MDGHYPVGIVADSLPIGRRQLTDQYNFPVGSQNTAMPIFDLLSLNLVESGFASL